MVDAVERAADLLLEARRDPASRLRDLPPDLRPADEAAAYAIQRAVTDQLGPVVGWKVAPLDAEGHSACSPLTAKLVVSGPAVLSSGRFVLRGVEAEVAVKLGRDLPPRATPYSREEVAEAIAAFLPAIEVLESRYAEPSAVSRLSGLADHQTNGLLVVGAPVSDWRAIDLAGESVIQRVDGAEDATRTGMPGGDLLGEVVWLANIGSTWAGGLLAGQVVTCGSWSGSHRVGPEARVEVEFSHVGRVELAFAPGPVGGTEISGFRG